MAQVPPPPQAEGRNIFCADKVVSSVPPAGVIIGLSLSLLIIMLTSPDCTSFAWANNRMKTRNNMIAVKATIEEITTTLISEIALI
jgi:hypothetical protein